MWTYDNFPSAAARRLFIKATPIWAIDAELKHSGRISGCAAAFDRSRAFLTRLPI
jgi:hypothetical protein